ncbi:hypothetical protein BN1723_001069, partial [Verticillium longisporum]
MADVIVSLKDPIVGLSSPKRGSSFPNPDVESDEEGQAVAQGVDGDSDTEEPDGAVRGGDSSHAHFEESSANGDLQEGMLPRDLPTRTTYYDPVAERQLSQTDAKLFYQRSQIGQKSISGSPMVTGHEAYDHTSQPPHIDHRLGEPALGSVMHSVAKLDTATRSQILDETPRPTAGIEANAALGAFSDTEPHITSELSSISKDIQDILDMRRKYIELSLQGPDDNPKDQDDWEIYPPPPEPAWAHQHGTSAGLATSGNSAVNSLHSSMVLPAAATGSQAPVSADPEIDHTLKRSSRKRKPGQNVGEDFVPEELQPVPGVTEMTFKLDDSGVYQVFDNKDEEANGRPLVQVPTIREFYMNLDQILSFSRQQTASQDPSSHPKLHIFLQRVIGFDSVDDESKVERRLFKKFPVPKVWDSKQNPPYSYWVYYMWSNMASLNALRKRRGFNTFVLRPHCGEAGDSEHLAVAALCCHSISHGLLLRKVPLLQYIYYLEQIGIAMSPLSNNALFLAYERNPFYQYFRRGLNVSLSTDDPLQFAFTKEPLMEEYAVAAQIYKLSSVDMCELAKNSVKQSGYEKSVKEQWLGPNFHLPGKAGNSMEKTNVPDRREDFRHQTLQQERDVLQQYIAFNTRHDTDASGKSQGQNTAKPASVTPQYVNQNEPAAHEGAVVATPIRMSSMTESPGLTESFSDVHISGREPIILPGVEALLSNVSCYCRSRKIVLV